MGKYVSVDTLMNTLGEAGFENLSGIAVDVSTSFLTGKLTSPMKAVTGSYLIKDSTQLATYGVELFAAAKEHLNPAALTQLTNDIVSSCVSICTGELNKLLKTYTSKVISFPSASYFGNEIWNRYTAYLAYELKDESILDFNKDELIDDINATAQQQIKEYKKNKNKEQDSTSDGIEKHNSKFKQKINKAVKDTSYFVSETNKKFGYWYSQHEELFQQIVTYAQNGPEWIANQVDREVRQLVKTASYYVSNGANVVIKKKEEMINSAINDVSSGLASLSAEIIKEQLADVQEDIENTKQAIEQEIKLAVVESLVEIQKKTGITVKIPKNLDGIKKAAKYAITITSLIVKLTNKNSVKVDIDTSALNDINNVTQGITNSISLNASKK